MLNTHEERAKNIPLAQTADVPLNKPSFLKKNFKLILLGGILLFLIIVLILVLLFKDSILGS